MSCACMSLAPVVLGQEWALIAPTRPGFRLQPSGPPLSTFQG